MRAGVAILSAVVLGAPLGGCLPRPPEAAPVVDPSPEAAAALVRSYYELVESGRLEEAAALREDGLKEDVAPFLSLKAYVAGPRRVEGRAGSVFVTVPVALSGRFVTGGDYRAGGRVVLRRPRAASGPDEGGWRIHRIQVAP